MVTAFNMKQSYNIVLLFLLLSGSFVMAQDKVVLKDGRKLKCKIVSINPSTITYKDSATAENMITIPKNDVLMAEFRSGSVYVFGNSNATTPITSPSNNLSKNKKEMMREKERTFSDNIIGVQIPDIFFGRLTLSYERLFLDKTMGITIPISLTYDPRILYKGFSTDTSNGASVVRRNVSYVTGLDLNYYFETRSHTKFFVGPRFRYGTDVFISNVTAYSVQFQNGFLFCSSNGKMASTFAIGFGFARILAIPGGGGINPNQSYPWASFTFRLGFRA